METWLVLICIALALYFLGAIASFGSNAIQARRERISKHEKELKAREAKLEIEKLKIEESRKSLVTISNEKSKGFPWLAKAYADYFALQDESAAEFLMRKKHPAKKAAQRVMQIAQERRKAEKLWRIMRYKLEYYENLFPWLVEFTAEDVDDLILRIMNPEVQDQNEGTGQIDPVRKWLTQAEYEQLENVNKFQIALDRYWSKKKKSWEIGRDYERYVGYVYEAEGYAVKYEGIVKGLEDLGRDLIARKGKDTKVIQCKCWRSERIVREKHVFQLFGTTVEYYIKNNPDIFAEGHPLFTELTNMANVQPTFITTSSLSEEAKKFAKVLGVHVKENFTMQNYPSIKCNISTRTGEKIYHLPFDQQYDRTIIEKEKNELYVETVVEAEALGYRRAFRWRGEKEEG